MRLPPAIAAGTVNGITQKVIIDGEAGSDQVIVDETAESSVTNLVSDRETVATVSYGRLTGLAAGNILYRNLETLDVNLGNAGNTAQIKSTEAGTTMYLRTGSGADTVTAGSTISDSTSTVNDLSGALDVNLQAGTDVLRINDSGDTAANTGALTSTVVSGLGTAGITYSNVETLNIDLGSGVDGFTIASTYGNLTNLRSQDGADNLLVQTVAGYTTIDAGLAGDTITVGDASHDLSGIVGQLDINGGGQTGDTLNVDDRAALAGLIGRVYTAGLAAGKAGVSGLDMTIGLNYIGIDAFNLTLGQGSDDLFIEGTNSATNVFDAYLGDDVINISSISGVTSAYGDRISDTSSTAEKGHGGRDIVRVNYGQDGRQTFENGVAALLTIGGGEDDDLLEIGLSGKLSNPTTNPPQSRIKVDSASAYPTDLGSDRMNVYGTNQNDLFLFRPHAIIALQTDADGNRVAAGGVERIDYTTVSGGITVFGRDGDDVFALDDTSSALTIYGDAGEDTFQVGQIFKSPRDANAGLALEDQFSTTLTTRGYLSNGVNFDAFLHGGAGNDTFTIYHNKANVFLYGEEDDDTFTVRAFVAVDPNDPLKPITNINGGKGKDLITYTVNAPVHIDGGDGSDTLIVVGTEFADKFVVTDTGVYGAGLFVTYASIENIVVDALEGNDQFFIASTPEGATVSTIGGKGSDTFNVAGNVDTLPIDVVSNDLLGHSGMIDLSIPTANTTDAGYQNTFVQDISASIQDNESAGIALTMLGGLLRVFEGNSGNALTQAKYSVVLTRSPKEDVRVTASPSSIKQSESLAGGKGIALNGNEAGTTLLFDRTNWFIPQIITVTAPADLLAEGLRNINIQHTVVQGADVSDGGEYDALAVPSPVVQVYDDDAAGVVITPASNGEVIVNQDTSVTLGSGADSYYVSLTREPTGPVTLNLNVQPDDNGNSQIVTQDSNGAVISSLTFSTSNPSAADYWSKPHLVKVVAAADTANVLQGTQFVRIEHSVAAASVNSLYGLDTDDVATGLGAKVAGDLTGQYTASVSGSTVTITGKSAFTASSPDSTVTITGAESAYTSVALKPVSSTAPVAGDTWTLSVNGRNYSYISGSNGDALTLAAVVSGLADAFTANAISGITATPHTSGIADVTLTGSSAFTARLIQSNGETTVISGTPAVGSYGKVQVQVPAGTVISGDAWTLTLGNTTFKYVAGKNGEMVALPSMDVTLTDKDAPGVLVTQSGGDTRVTEPTDLVLLGGGEVTNAGTSSGYGLKVVATNPATVMNAVTIDFSITESPSVTTVSAGKGTVSGTQVWTSADILLTGTVATGNTWTVRVEGANYSYIATATDTTLDLVAAGLKGVLSAGLSSSGYAVNDPAAGTGVTLVKAGTGFTAQMVSGGATITGNSAWRNPTLALSGAVGSSETWTVRLNGTNYSYTTASNGSDTLSSVADQLMTLLAAPLSSAQATVSKVQLTQFVANFGAAELNEAAGTHDSIFTAQAIDVDSWNIQANADILDATTRPHLTVHGTGNGQTDVYKFNISSEMLHANGPSDPVTPVTATFDIDHGFDYYDSIFWASQLSLFKADGTLIARGPGYSNPFDASAGGSGSTTWLDDFLTYQFTATGDYYLEVSNWIPLSGNSNGLPNGVDYDLQVSIDRHKTANFVLEASPVLKVGDGIQDVDAANNWYTFADPKIGNGTDIHSSTPYVKISGSGDGTTDSYRFEVTSAMLTQSGGTAGTTVTETPGRTYYTSADLQLSGRVQLGDVWTLTLDGLDYAYTVTQPDADAEAATAGSGIANIASGLATKITSRTTTDTNDITTGATYAAAVSTTDSATIKLTDANGFWFDMNHRLDDAAVVLRQGAVQGNSALPLTSADVVFSGTVAIGDTWTVTLNGTNYSFTAVTTSLDAVAAGLDAAIGTPAGVTVLHTASSNTLNIAASAGSTFTVAVKESGETADGVAKITNAFTRAAYAQADIALSSGTVLAGDTWTLTLVDQANVSKTFTSTGFTSSDAVATDLVTQVNAASGVTYSATHFDKVVRLADLATGKFFTISIAKTGSGTATATVNGTAVQTDTSAVKWTNASLALNGTYKAGETYTVTVNAAAATAYTATYVAGAVGTAVTTSTVIAPTTLTGGTTLTVTLGASSAQNLTIANGTTYTTATLVAALNVQIAANATLAGRLVATDDGANHLVLAGTTAGEALTLSGTRASQLFGTATSATGNYAATLSGVAQALRDTINSKSPSGKTYTATASSGTLTIADAAGVTLSYGVTGATSGVAADASTWTKVARVRHHGNCGQHLHGHAGPIRRAHQHADVL